MKKLLSILAVVALLACLGCMNAYADTVVLDENTNSATSDRDVIVNVKDGNGDIIGGSTETGSTEKVYSVDVAWEAMTFVFVTEQTADELVWDPDTHTYENLEGQWEDATAVITVTNHSNAEVDVAAAFSNGTTVSEKLGVTATVTGTDGPLASAVGTTLDNAPSMTYNVTVTGEPTQLAPFTVDNVVVTLSND